MSLGFKADEVVDAQGLFCPMPAVKLKMKLEMVKAGQVIELIATDPAAREDIPAWSEATGQELLGFEETQGVWHFFIKKSESRQL